RFELVRFRCGHGVKNLKSPTSTPAFALRFGFPPSIESPARGDRPYILHAFTAMAHQPIVQVHSGIAVTRDQSHFLTERELAWAGGLDDAMLIRGLRVARACHIADRRHAGIDAVRLQSDVYHRPGRCGVAHHRREDKQTVLERVNRLAIVPE